MSYEKLRKDANLIIDKSIASVLPDAAVKRALKTADFGGGRLILVSIGKAGWQMAKAAADTLGDRINGGIVITKYDHVRGEIPSITCFEAGHPVPDENSFRATAEAISMVSDLTPEDWVLFLVSGGGSALFESPAISGEELADITGQLLASGASIDEMNTIRKRLSLVKGGRFAKICEPAQVFSIVLSDVLGDSLDVIASGPAYPDASTSDEALRIAKNYGLRLSAEAEACLHQETPKALGNVTTQITGSVRELCAAAEAVARDLGYEPVYITDQLCCEAAEAGVDLARQALKYVGGGHQVALIEGGETVVKLKGSGRGGRNQELALSAATEIENQPIAVFSVGSDGTDGPTDAAGGYVDGACCEKLAAAGIDLAEHLADNDSYPALKAIDGLIMTGPTGTNVNDLSVALILAFSKN